VVALQRLLCPLSLLQGHVKVHEMHQVARFAAPCLIRSSFFVSASVSEVAANYALPLARHSLYVVPPRLNDILRCGLYGTYAMATMKSDSITTCRGNGWGTTPCLAYLECQSAAFQEIMQHVSCTSPTTFSYSEDA
jgi:hypothetical protein